MMQQIQLFSFKDNILVINRKEILMHQPFADIIKKDKGSVGDSDGRKKLYATKVFKYIYFMCDVDSFPNTQGYNENDCHKYAVTQAGLDSTFKVNSDISKAMMLYKRYNTNAVQEQINTLNRRFRALTKIIETLGVKLDDLVDKDELSIVELSTASTLIASLMGYEASIPALIDNLSLLEHNYLSKKDDISTNEVARGGNENISISYEKDGDFMGKFSEDELEDAVLDNIMI